MRFSCLAGLDLTLSAPSFAALLALSLGCSQAAMGTGGSDSDVTVASNSSVSNSASTDATSMGPGTATAGTDPSGSGSTESSGGNTASSSGTGGTTGPGPTTGAEMTGSSSSGSTTTGEPEAECVSDEDCALLDDCCACEGYPVDEEPFSCDEECPQTQCEIWGADAVVCKSGQCVLEDVNCDTSTIICDAPEPACDPGYAPGVTPDGTCYTFECVPVEVCNYVPSCDDCEGVEGVVCVKDNAFVTKVHCELIPLGCDGVADCECAGDELCVDIFTQCAEVGPDIECTCPDC